MQGATLDVLNAVDPGRKVDDGLGGQDLPGSGLRAETRREVQGTAAIAALDRDRLAGVQPDPHTAREPDLPELFL